jgi:hypothetical protein
LLLFAALMAIILMHINLFSRWHSHTHSGPGILSTARDEFSSHNPGMNHKSI